MKKKFFALGFCEFVLAFGLVACGDDSSSNSESNVVKGELLALADGSGEKLCDEKLEDRVAETFDKDFRRCQNGEWTKITANEASAEEEIIGGVTELHSSSSIQVSSSSSTLTSSSSLTTSSSSSLTTSSSSDATTSSSSSTLTSSSSVPTEDFSSSSSSPKANWAYLNPDIDYGEFTDVRDGQIYKTVKIGSQTWMAENLNYDPGNVSNMGEGAWSGCYDNENANCSLYGRLYTWSVAMDNADCAGGKECKPSGTIQGVCPSGWHLPTKEEWQELVEPFATSVKEDDFDVIYNDAGIALKTVEGWSECGTNSSGFSALPVGIWWFDGFADLSIVNVSSFWSASELDDESVNMLSLPDFGRELIISVMGLKSAAISVRCVQDE